VSVPGVRGGILWGKVRDSAGRGGGPAGPPHGRLGRAERGPAMRMGPAGEPASATGGSGDAGRVLGVPGIGFEVWFLAAVAVGSATGTDSGRIQISAERF
jgi:hypothetical protein